MASIWWCDGVNGAGRVIAFVAAVLLTGCAKPTNVFMDTPALYSSAGVDIDRVTSETRRTPTMEILYATDRVYDADNPEEPYIAERDRYLRLGVAQVRLGEEETTWSRLAEETSALDRRKEIRMYLDGVEDFGPLADSVWRHDPLASDPSVNVPGERFATLVNERLSTSRRPFVVVYVAPFKVDFDVATFTAAEFYHYLGRDGVFITYSWPTETGTLDYFSATENAYLTVSNLRLFLDYLARETDAERIHLMTYSAGARVLSGAMQQLRLRYSHMDEARVKDHLRIGNVVFTGPDIDAQAFGLHYRDGAAEVAEAVTIYTTKRDRALGMSRWIFGWDRLGSLDVTDFSPHAIEYLQDEEAVAFVVVTEAENASQDNAHGYFRHSPWVSTDILLTLALGLPPDERCLYREPGDPRWHFPEDYREKASRLVERLTEERASSSSESP